MPQIPLKETKPWKCPNPRIKGRTKNANYAKQEKVVPMRRTEINKGKKSLVARNAKTMNAKRKILTLSNDLAICRVPSTSHHHTTIISVVLRSSSVNEAVNRNIIILSYTNQAENKLAQLFISLLPMTTS